MAWTAEITAKSLDGIYGVFTVRFADGKRTITETFKIDSPSSDAMQRRIAGRIKSLEAVDTLVDATSVGAVTITPKEPTADDLAAAKWFEDLRTLRNLLACVDRGLIAADMREIGSLKLSLSEGFKITYASDPRFG